VTVSVKMVSLALSSLGRGAGRMVNRVGRARNELTKSASWRSEADVEGPGDEDEDEGRYGGYSKEGEGWAAAAVAGWWAGFEGAE
jgi:hypothetical protein